MTIHTIIAHVFVHIPAGGDPEEVAADFDRGLSSAVEHFPGATVISTDVEGITPTSDEVIKERALDAELDEIQRG